MEGGDAHPLEQIVRRKRLGPDGRIEGDHPHLGGVADQLGKARRVAVAIVVGVDDARLERLYSVGGVIECVVRGVPAGLGEPVFDKLEAELAKAMMSLPPSKGFEIGSGFGGTLLTGLEHNDEFYMDGSRVRTRTNRSGGVQGGISNGEDIVFRVAFKPTATVLREQKTVNTAGEDTTLAARGRHDACVLPRAVPMIEAMVHLVMVDHWLRQRCLG